MTHPTERLHYRPNLNALLLADRDPHAVERGLPGAEWSAVQPLRPPIRLLDLHAHQSALPITLHRERENQILRNSRPFLGDARVWSDRMGS